MLRRLTQSSLTRPSLNIISQCRLSSTGTEAKQPKSDYNPHFGGVPKSIIKQVKAQITPQSQASKPEPITYVKEQGRIVYYHQAGKKVPSNCFYHGPGMYKNYVRQTYTYQKKYIIDKMRAHVQDAEWIMVVAAREDFNMVFRFELHNKLPNVRTMFSHQNKVCQLALQTTPYDGIKNLLFGKNVVIVQKNKENAIKDMNETLKMLTKNPEWVVLGGWFQGTVVSAEQIETIRKITDENAERAKVISLVKGPYNSLIRALDNQKQTAINVLKYKYKDAPEAQVKTDAPSS